MFIISGFGEAHRDSCMLKTEASCPASWCGWQQASSAIGKEQGEVSQGSGFELDLSPTHVTDFLPAVGGFNFETKLRLIIPVDGDSSDPDTNDE